MPYKTMRDAFIERIYQRMKGDRNIFFLSADFGAPLLDKLRNDLPDRFINVGIAEQNLVNLAAGLALEGYAVYAYGLAPFLTMRPYEQIRVNLSMLSQLRKINVNLVGVGAGISYAVSGPTHHCLEDLGIMRMLPGIVIFSPSDTILIEKFIDYTLTNKSPKYLRFDGAALPPLYGSCHDLVLDNGFYELAKGGKVCIVSTGYMTHKALSIKKRLLENAIAIGVIDVFMLKPINEELFFAALDKYASIVTLEEAFINKGGLDGLVSSVMDKYHSRKNLRRMGFGDAYVFDIGSREYLHKINNLDEDRIIQKIGEITERGL